MGGNMSYIDELKIYLYAFSKLQEYIKNSNEKAKTSEIKDEGDLVNLGSKSNVNNNKKTLNKHMNSRNDNELEAFSYPFKEDDLCSIF